MAESSGEPTAWKDSFYLNSVCISSLLTNNQGLYGVKLCYRIYVQNRM